MREGRQVKHPLIDRVRDCSSTPDAAADFFRLVFQFKPENRLLHDAACHAYLSATFDRMKAAPSIPIDLSSDVVEGERSSPCMPFDTAIRHTSCNLHIPYLLGYLYNVCWKESFSAMNHAELSCLSLSSFQVVCDVCLQMVRHLGLMMVMAMMMVHPVLNNHLSKHLHSSLSSQLRHCHCRKHLSITPCGLPIILLSSGSLCILTLSHQNTSQLPALIFLSSIAVKRTIL